MPKNVDNKHFFFCAYSYIVEKKQKNKKMSKKVFTKIQKYAIIHST